jgi:hypothetical protein
MAVDQQPVCPSCGGSLEDVKITGYRMTIADPNAGLGGRLFGNAVDARSCVDCGLITLWRG